MNDRYVPKDRVPLPPSDARVYTTACDYCIVGCGYKAFVWPVGREGGPRAGENALNMDFPTGILRGWISPNQHNIVQVGGRPHHAVVIPDPDATVVNRNGNHSIRGGTIALKCFNPEGPTRDRLQHPMIRIADALRPVAWDEAIDVMAEVSRHVLARHGETAWAMKTYSYQFFENTYAISKLAFGAIGTPAYSPHDKPGAGPDTAGLDDSGVEAFSASYEDWSLADVIFISGTDPFETKTVIFTEWMMKGNKPKLIFALPRKTTGVAYAEAHGGLFLQVIPGTDTILHLAIARVILENGWEDKQFVATRIARDWEINRERGRGTYLFGTDFEGYKTWLLGYKYAELGVAEQITGVSAESIRRAAEMLAKPIRGKRIGASFALEKGNYWSNNYLNTASFAALALLCGAGTRPGRVISRLGGHQRGWMGAAGYPMAKSPERLPGGRRKELDLDRWVEAGRVRFAWVIGTTWIQSMAASAQLSVTFEKMTRGSPHQIRTGEKAEMIDTLKKRVDDGGMVVVHQDIYLVDPIGARFADIVLPAATWGEEDFTRANGERRLRLYSKFYPPPGQAKPDWWIVSRVAQKMGYRGFDWADSNQIFEEAAQRSRGDVLDYSALVAVAKQQGKRGHDLLRTMGTTGIQCPIRLEGGQLVGTKRLHDETLRLGAPEGGTVYHRRMTVFDTDSGKAILHRSPWELFADFYERVKPGPGEFWVTNGRINEVWQSAFDDQRKPYLAQRWPDTWVEIHPDDAKPHGIESGDVVRMTSDDVPVQTGGFEFNTVQELKFSHLEQQGLIRKGKGEAVAVAIVTDAVRRGVLFTNFLWLGSPANSLVPRVPDPLTNRYRFKLGKARIERIEESPYKRSFEAMTFKPRTIMR